MREDELWLLDYLRASTRDVLTVRDAINAQDRVHHKRCWYLLEKWVRKGWYNYGVCVDMGWFR